MGPVIAASMSDGQDHERGAMAAARGASPAGKVAELDRVVAAASSE